MYHEKLKGPVPGRDTEPNELRSKCNASDTSELEPNQVAADLARARAHLEKRAEANRIIASWRDYLRERIERATLQSELIGLSDEEHDVLVDEVATFKRLCAAIGWSPSGRRRS